MNKPVITLVGCGFIGSHLAEELPKLLFSQQIFSCTFRFIDFDTWEERNAANQHVNVYTASSNEYKAETCGKYVEGYPDYDIEVITEKLTPKNAKDLLDGSTLIIDAVDNIPTRQLLWGFAKSGRAGPCLHVGISRKGDGIINWSSPGFDTFPFNPASVAGRKLAEQDFKEPPCEMYKYRAAGMSLIQTTAKAVSFFFGRDPWKILGKDLVEKGMMTVWQTDDQGYDLILEDYTLDEDGCIPNVIKKEDE